MRGLLMVVCVLAQLVPPAASDASTSAVPAASALATASSAPRAAVEAGLLSVLGLGRRPPRVDRSRVVIPPAMLDLYRSQTGQDLDTTALPLPGRLTRNANTVRSFTHKESAIDARFPHGDRFRLHFDVAGAPAEERLTAAELRLSSLPEGERHAGGGRRQRVRVSDIVRPGRRGESKPTLRLVDTRTVDGDEPVSLDVLPACERWRREPDHNHGLLVEVEVEEGEGSARNQSHVRLRRSADQGEDEWLRQRPLLVLFADDGKRPERPAGGDALARRRRATAAASGRKHKRKDGRDNCRRHPLYVDFADVGWNDWIVAPPGYDAYYCQGDCPFPMADHLNSTNHAIVQTLVNSVNPGAVPKACCVPTALTSISMLYLDEENKVVLKNYQDMAVLGCGCR